VFLSGLSEAEKDALVLAQQATIAELQAAVAEVAELRASVLELQTIVTQQHTTIAELQAKLAADSTKSNRPPSSDGFGKGPPKPRSLRRRTGKKSGGQPGHPGSTLEFSATPDHVVVHAPPSACDVCAAALPEPTVLAARQVVDLPEFHSVVTEHRVLESLCTCGKLHRGRFPAGVDVAVQYGPRTQALAVYLTQHQMLPVQRAAALISDLFGMSVSQGTVLNAAAQAAARLGPTVDAIAQGVRSAAVAHADETGLRVAATLHWLHTVTTPLLTWVGVHAKRGYEAMVAFGILPSFRGVLIHDGWASYRHFDCLHGLCNAHHLRELAALAEDHGQRWAARMSDLLKAACHEVNLSADGCLADERIRWYHSRYNTIIRAGERECPARPSSGKRGRTKQSAATNLLRRLRDGIDDVWRFAREPDVPFTNNLAEQAIRMPKVKQKISGGFRTDDGARIFCVIRSYLETMRKQDANLFGTLITAFEGTVTQPQLA
jgi:transposase